MTIWPEKHSFYSSENGNKKVNVFHQDITDNMFDQDITDDVFKIK